jgi:hypothetical protein
MQHIGPAWWVQAGYAAQNAVYFAETSENRLIRLNILHSTQDISHYGAQTLQYAAIGAM